jgi:predicted nucleic acid-binding protein
LLRRYAPRNDGDGSTSSHHALADLRVRLCRLATARPAYVSAATLAEIRFGIELVADPSRRAELNDWLAHKVRPMFDERVLPITEDIMLKWRLLVEDGRKAGHTFSQPDLIIAATALHHGLTLVTRDVSDYRKARAAVLNPWLGAEPTSAS